MMLMLGALTACASTPSRNPLAEWVPSPNHGARKPILIVLHATTQRSVADSLRTLSTRNSGGPVSAHYLVAKDGARYQLVADDRRAWHAGPGRWGAITDVNSASIGIELDNDGDSPFPPSQIASLASLLKDLCERHDIPPTQVVAHSDIAPSRKRDPGRRFPWQRLFELGYGIWPDANSPPPPVGFDSWLALRALGYSLDDRAAAARAFHLHFRGIETDTLDDEDARILFALSR